MRAAWYIDGTARRLARSFLPSMPSLRTLITAWVIERLPAVKTTNSRSPGSSKMNIFWNVATRSTPALVREFETMTRPASRSMPTQ